MMKKTFNLFLIILIGLTIVSPFFASALADASAENSVETKLEINFFYSETCIHCKAENAFLDKIEVKYPNVKFNRHSISEADCRKELIDFCNKYNLEQYIGLVPLTLVGEEFFPGFDNENGVGKKIEDSITRQMENYQPPKEKERKIHLPIIGTIDLNKYSLLMQAIILGFFDGFNVCSLGALIMILGLVLILKSRPRIILFGGLYILVTAVIYGLLIFLWYQLFYYLSPVLKIMNVFVGVLGILGAVYFLKQFLKARKQNLVCDSQGNKIINRQSLKIQEAFQKSGGILGIIIGIIIFASIITIVEFPCSAVVPVLFAGVMANAELSLPTYILYLLIYILFYMLDEIVVFLIAVFTMNIKIVSGKAMKWLNLIEAIVLLGMGIYYLIGVF